MMLCDTCNQPTQSLTEISDKRFQKPISKANARVCPECFKCWSSGNDEELLRRIKVLKLQLGGKSNDN